MIVTTCFVDLLEGNLTDTMQKKYTNACQEVLQEIQHAMTKNGATVLSTYQSQPLLCDKVSKKLTKMVFIVISLNAGKSFKVYFKSIKEKEDIIYSPEEYATATGMHVILGNKHSHVGMCYTGLS